MWLLLLGLPIVACETPVTGRYEPAAGGQPSAQEVLDLEVQLTRAAQAGDA